MTRVTQFKVDPAWIRTRKAILAELKRQVRSHLGEVSADIQKDQALYEEELRQKWQPSTKAELLAQIEKCDIVYGGDFHAFAQAQRTHLKILRDILPRRPRVLALEAFSAQDNEAVAAYLSGHLSESQFLKKTKWHKNWGFPWEHYRPLLEWARDAGCHVRGVGTGGRHLSLRQREKEAAKAIQKIRKDHSEALIYVLFGDLHLVDTHLPQAVRKALKQPKLRDLTIFLNSERIYFQLAHRGLEHEVDLVRMSRRQYCVMSSPPWVQWQSYLMYLEKNTDLDLEETDGLPDFTDQVARMIGFLGQDLGVQMKADDIAVYSSQDDRIWSRLKTLLSKSELKIAETLMTEGRSFFVPQGGIFYLARPTINHAAELAGQYLHARLSGRKQLMWKMPDQFPALIWIEVIGYFMSKLINHKRQTETLADLRSRLESMCERDQGREALLLALEQRTQELIWAQEERWRPLRFRPRRASSFFVAAKILGGMMGERLFVAFRSRKLTSKGLILLLQASQTHSQFFYFYADIVTRLGTGGDIGKPKKERL